MNCQLCGEANPEPARFCMACGQALVPAADAAVTTPAERPGAADGSAAPPPASPAPADRADQRLLDPFIPAGLLTKLAAARRDGAGLGERRVVTMLFCDVQGSTAAARELDPEEWAEVMNGAFAELIAPVYRYEGTLARLMGDGILAFFGAPIAHEDDPERAVLAGLEIVAGVSRYRRQVAAQWGIDFSVRVGIHTGLVMVGEIGSDLRVEYTAMGNAVNLAARMEQTAAPNSVQITAEVHRLIAHRFSVEDLGAIPLRGMEAPVNAYRVLRARARPGSLRGIEGLHAPLIGRERELAALAAAVARLQAGHGSVAAIIGEAGVGKSRLVAELRHQVNAEAPAAGELRWLEGRTLSYHRETPFAPFIDLFSGCLGLRPGPDDDAGPWDRLLEGLTSLVPEHAAALAPFFGALLGVPVPEGERDRIRFLQPQELREQIFAAVGQLLARLAAAQPLVLVLEDLHWSDDTSLDLLAQLMPLTEQTMLMIVGVFRPWEGEDQTRRFAALAAEMAGDAYLSLELQPLNEAESRHLIASLLEIEGLPDAVRGLILTRTEGNPFFIEEVIRGLIDEGAIVQEGAHWRATATASRVAIPHTLASVLTARLDRLDEPVRRVAQVASVIGREFAVDVLAALDGVAGVLEPALAELERRALVQETARRPRRICQFKHVLTQEAAYNSLLLRRRRQLHRRLAEHLAATEPGAVSEIAHHFWAAREHLKALPYLIEAGDRAAGRYATREAIRWYERALEVVEQADDPELVQRLYEGYGSALTTANEIDQALDVYETMLVYAAGRDLVSMRISALNKLALVGGLMREDFGEADRRLEEAETLARRHEDLDGLSEVSIIRCMQGTLMADHDRVVAHMGELAEMSRRFQSKGQLAMSLEHMAEHQLFLTRYDEAWETVQEAIEVAREAGDLLHEAMALTVVAEIQLRNGDLAAAHASATEAWTIAERTQAAEALALTNAQLGQLNLMRGDFEAALEHYEAALADSRIATAVWVQPLALAGLGTVHLRIGGENKERARAYHAEAEGRINTLFGSITGSFACAELGFCALEAGELERAATLIEQGLTQPGAWMHVMRPHLLVGSAMVAVGQNDAERAALQLQRARRQVGAAGMRHVEPMLAVAEGRWAEARGDHAGALVHYQEAAEKARHMGMRPLLWEALNARARLLAATGHQGAAEATGAGAETVLSEMAEGFRDPVLRERFLTTQRQAWA